MNLHYQYYWFKEVIPHDVCDKIIKMGNEQIELIRKDGGDASGITRGGGEKTKDDKRVSAKELTPKEQNGGDYYARDCQVAWFNNQWLYDLVWPYLLEANESSGWKWDIEWAEAFQFVKYKERTEELFCSNLVQLQEFLTSSLRTWKDQTNSDSKNCIL